MTTSFLCVSWDQKCQQWTARVFCCCRVRCIDDLVAQHFVCFMQSSSNTKVCIPSLGSHLQVTPFFVILYALLLGDASVLSRLMRNNGRRVMCKKQVQARLQNVARLDGPQPCLSDCRPPLVRRPVPSTKAKRIGKVGVQALNFLGCSRF